MVGNFDFLKTVDKNLYEIINDAEKLYRGEFFEQCMGQTRRFGEKICRNVLAKNRTKEITFDEMLATLKDKTNGSEQEKEFIDDLYFLKKQGNTSVHSDKVTHSSTTALECLQRAFEIAVNYAVYHKKADVDILKLRYDTELMVTGNQSKKSLSEKYIEARDKALKINQPKKNKPQVSSIKSVPRQTGFPIFWTIVGVSLFIAFCTLIFILI